MPLNAVQYSMPNLEIEQLKRSALLFQTTYYCSMPTYLAYRPTYKWQPVPGFEMEMPLEFGLSEKGILRHVADPFALHGSGPDARDVDREALEAVRPALEELERQIRASGEADKREGYLRYLGIGTALQREAANDIRSRRIAAHLEQETGERVVPILKSPSAERLRRRHVPTCCALF